MKIAQFTNKKFSASWFVWNVSTFKALHPEWHEVGKTGYVEFSDTIGTLKPKDVKLITECRVTVNGEVVSGFSACSKEDRVYLPVGMKIALERAIKDVKDRGFVVSKSEIAEFYNSLFKEGTFGFLMLGVSNKNSDRLKNGVAANFEHLLASIDPPWVACSDGDDDEDNEIVDDLNEQKYCDALGCDYSTEDDHICIVKR